MKSSVRESGYWHRVCFVDLSDGSVKYFDPGKDVYKNFIGGKGLGAKLLFDNTEPKIDPLSPDNVLVFSVGPIEGLALPSAARMALCFKSPLTNFFGESYCGGYIGTEMAKAGLDAIVVKGASKKPVYLYVEDGEVQIRDASDLWGLNTLETEKALWKEHGDKVQTAVIGQAGENLVKFACIVHGIYQHSVKGLRGGFLGRTGGGAVMGSKKLKAIAIRGTLEVVPADEKAYEELRREVSSKARNTLTTLAKYGTSGIMALTQSTGSLPTRYYQGGSFDGYEKVGPEAMNSTIVKKHITCYACPVACGRHSIVEYEGKTIVLEGPEYETLYALSPLCGIDDLAAVAAANELANLYGLDTITLGNVVGFAMYLAERGLLKENDIGVKFGDGSSLVRAVEAIAFKRGLGKILAEGTKRAAEILGFPELAVHVKGLEFPGYDPRGLKGVALAYAVSQRGACHLRHVAYRPNLTGKHPFKPDVPVNRLAYEGHAEYVAEQEDFYAVIDSLIMCKFYSLPTIGPMLWEGVTAIYNMATGAGVNAAELRRIGERINNLIRLYNIREGLTRKDDYLPERMYKDPFAFGASKGEVVDRGKFEQMLDEFYSIKGWTKEGRPKPEKLAELGLTEYAKKIGLA